MALYHRYLMTCHDCGKTWTASIPASFHKAPKDSHDNVTHQPIERFDPDDEGKREGFWRGLMASAGIGRTEGGAASRRRVQAEPRRSGGDVRVSKHIRRVNGRTVDVRSHTRQQR